jgi:hypothetical protein
MMTTQHCRKEEDGGNLSNCCNPPNSLPPNIFAPLDADRGGEGSGSVNVPKDAIDLLGVQALDSQATTLPDGDDTTTMTSIEEATLKEYFGVIIAATSKEADGHRLVKSETKTVGMWGVTDPNEVVNPSASNHDGKPATQEATLDLSHRQPCSRGEKVSTMTASLSASLYHLIMDEIPYPLFLS